jgi:NADPH-dependent curcumin reductase
MRHRRERLLDAGSDRPAPEREILTRLLRWSGFIIFDHVAELPASVAAPTMASLIIAVD